MPDNVDSVMVILNHPSGSAPAGWAHFDADDLIARRVSYADFRKLQLVGKKLVAAKVFQQNPSGSNPFQTVYSGDDAYSFLHDAVNSCIFACNDKAVGGGKKTDRTAFVEFVQGGGQQTETWDDSIGQVPMEGASFQDSNPSQSQLSAAEALTTDDVALG